MNSMARALLIAGLTLLVMPVTQAQQRAIVPSVDPLSTTVTYRATEADKYVVGYTVSIANNGSSTVNNVRFEGYTTVGDPLVSGQRLVAQYQGTDAISPTACTTVDSGIVGTSAKVVCQLGTLTSGASRKFYVFFSSPLVTDGIDRTVNFTTSTIFAEGTTDNPNNPPANDTVVSVVSPVALGTLSANDVRTALTPAGGEFFTSPVDQFASKVKVPPQQSSSYVALLEKESLDINTCNSNRNFFKCYESDISVENVIFAIDSGNYLTFVLRIDSSNIRNGAKIDRTIIRYSSPAVGTIPAIDVPNLYACSKDLNGNPVPNANYVPCIVKAVAFNRKKDPTISIADDGDFEFTIINLKNGKLGIF